MHASDRFYVRASPSGHGVFDRAMNGWHGPQNRTEENAARVAEELNAAIEATNKPTTRRPVNPPKRVRARLNDGAVVEGTLHAWDRGNGQWMGEVEFTPDRRIWVNADDLRPC